MPTHGYNVKEITKHAMNALNSSNLTTAEVAGLANADALRAIFTNRATGGFTQRQDMEFHEESIRAATVAVATGTLPIFNDTNVAGAVDLDALRDILIAVNPELSRTYQSGNRAWS